MIADDMSIQKLFSKSKLMEIFDSKNGKKDQKLAFFFGNFSLENCKNLKNPTFAPFVGIFDFFLQ